MVNVKLAKELAEEYNSMAEEVSKGNLANEKEFKAITRAIDKLKQNPKCGVYLPKARIPKKYIEKYGVENWFGLRLSREARLFYTLKGQSVEIIAFVFDWFFSHKDYEKVLRNF